jgi:hypothetical protein
MSLAIDLQEITEAFDTMDATDDTDRQRQSMLYMATESYIEFIAIRAGGAGNYLMPSHVDEIDRAAYESIIDNGVSAIEDLLAAYGAAISLV